MKQVILTEKQRSTVHKIEYNLLKEFDRVCRKYEIKYCLAYGSLLGAVRHGGFIPWDDDIDVCMPRSDYEKFKAVAQNEVGDNYFFQSHETDKEYMLFYGRLRDKNTIFQETYFEDYNMASGVYIDIFPVEYYDKTKLSMKIYWGIFRICRVLLNSKYYKMEARTGMKKQMSKIVRILSGFLSCDFLYNLQNYIASCCNTKKGNCYINLTSPYGKKDCFEVELYDTRKEVTFEDGKYWTYLNMEKVLETIYGDYMQLPPIEKRVTVHHLSSFDFSKYVEEEC